MSVPEAANPPAPRTPLLQHTSSAGNCLTLQSEQQNSHSLNAHVAIPTIRPWKAKLTALLPGKDREPLLL